jgi:hypothetical protein
MTATATRRLDDLAYLSKTELEAMLRAGATPEWEALQGWIFRGWNVGFMPHVLRIKKFAKLFFEKDGKRMGGNCPVRQGALAEAWRLKPSNEAPKRFGFYEVRATRDGERDHRHANALLLDYGRGGNPWFEPAKVLRDHLVQVDPGNKDLYLGKAWVALGPARVFAGYFVLERLARIP